ncbi:MAG: hypothetical protein IJU26_01690 [Synergistaceae bacterium]|nr:hypothetical protein [Synergistaceae bacterium]
MTSEFFQAYIFFEVCSSVSISAVLHVGSICGTHRPRQAHLRSSGSRNRRVFRQFSYPGHNAQGTPAGSTIDLTTNSTGGVGAPVPIQRKRAGLIVANAGPSLWSYERTKTDYQFGGCPHVRSIAGGLAHEKVRGVFGLHDS